jgi:putative spermidine/putrescine transport system substrate-binding protein
MFKVFTLFALVLSMLAFTSRANALVIGVYSGEWEEWITESSIKPFIQSTGIQVEIVPGADAEWLTKLKAANGRSVPYDILILQQDSIRLAHKQGLLQELRVADVPNLADIYPSVNNNFVFDGKLYATAHSIGQLGIAYRRDIVKNPPLSWADLWKDQYKGQVAISPLTYAAGLQFFSYLLRGGTVDEAFARLKDLKKNIVAYPDGGGAIQTLLERGDAPIVPFWDGRTFSLEANGVDVGFVYPSDGPVAAVASWVIAKNAPDLKNAYKLLNYLLSPKAQQGYSERSFYATSNRKNKYSEKFASKAKYGEAFFDTLVWVDYDQATPNLQEWSSRWQQALE